jgi:hypothetical protein
MVITWRARAVQGGSGWRQAGLAVALVGIVTTITAPAIDTIDVQGSYTPILSIMGGASSPLEVAGTFGVNVMATEVTLGGPGKMFVGEDKTLRLTGVTDGDGVLIDLSGWTIHFVAATFTKTATVSGAFNVDPDLNAQVAAVALTAAETTSLDDTRYPYSFKRVDSGFNEILAYGNWPVQRATQ